jgi:hypothetical protein
MLRQRPNNRLWRPSPSDAALGTAPHGWVFRANYADGVGATEVREDVGPLLPDLPPPARAPRQRGGLLLRARAASSTPLLPALYADRHLSSSSTSAGSEPEGAPAAASRRGRLLRPGLCECHRRGMQPVRLAGGWWLVLVCSERRVLLSGLLWEKSTAGWWLISQANRAMDPAPSDVVCRGPHCPEPRPQRAVGGLLRAGRRERRDGLLWWAAPARGLARMAAG